MNGFSEEKENIEMEIKQNMQLHGNELIEINRKHTRPYSSLEYLTKSQNIEINVVSANNTKNGNDIVFSYRKITGYIYIYYILLFINSIEKVQLKLIIMEMVIQIYQ